MTSYTSVTFAWQGNKQPGLWCPALGPGLTPMQPDGDGWAHTTNLPDGTSVSWAIAPDINALGELSPALLDAALTSPQPAAPSLFRLIGTNPSLKTEANISILQQPGAPDYDWSVLGNPVAHLPGEDLASGHKIRYGTAGDSPQVLFLDGEVFQRIHQDFLDISIAPTYVHNSGIAQRMGDFADPVGFARVIGNKLDKRPDVVVGVSAAAFAACALAVEVGASKVVMISPAVVAGVGVLRELVGSLLDAGVEVVVAAGSEKHQDGDGVEKSLFAMAQGFSDGIVNAGGRSSFTVFPGGHDLAAWRPVFAQLLGGA